MEFSKCMSRRGKVEGKHGIGAVVCAQSSRRTGDLAMTTVTHGCVQWQWRLRAEAPESGDPPGGDFDPNCLPRLEPNRKEIMASHRLLLTFPQFQCQIPIQENRLCANRKSKGRT
jgi:hypothetical protein